MYEGSRNPLLWFILLVSSVTLSSCGPKADSDPLRTLNTPIASQTDHKQAMEVLADRLEEQRVRDAFERIIMQQSYTVEVREAALNHLAEHDLEGTKLLIRRTLPRMTVWPWVTRLSEIIAERGWVDLSPALVSSWSRKSAYVTDDLQRPEYLALKQLHGEERVTDVVYQIFLESNQAGEHGLRTRCWDLLHRLGGRERLIELLAGSEVPAEDALLIDLRAGARELGIVPRNREEILWLRKLREPERAEFWSRAVEAIQRVSAERRAELGLRDLPILVSASLYEPELMDKSIAELYERVASYVSGQRHHVQDSNYDGFTGGSHQRLYEFRDQLTWGDLAAMLVAIRAVQVPEVVGHLFDYTARDRADETTEYGGVISLDARDRFEVLEFPPVMRRHDNEFIASQEMLDEAYTSIFHFHLHVQNVRNGRFAGPGFGDMNYAENTRANCLVFTSINQDTLNADYYRHGRVVVDLGEIKRPDAESSNRP